MESRSQTLLAQLHEEISADHLGPPKPDDLHRARHVGRDCSKAGITLSALREAYIRATRHHPATPNCLCVPRRHPPGSAHHAGPMWTRLIKSYVSHLCLYGTHSAAQREFISLVLDGPAADDVVAMSADRLLPAYYQSLTVRLAQNCTTAKALQLRRHMAKATHGTLVLLVEASTAEITLVAPREANQQVTRLVEDVIEMSGTAVKTGLAVGPRPLRGVVATSRQIAELAPSSRCPSSIYRIADVVLEAAISRAPDLDLSLQDIVAPLRDQPDLITTLRALYDNDLHRGRTATALCVHPRTLDYRLAKVRRLCAIDPTSVHGIAHFHIALKRLATISP